MPGCYYPTSAQFTSYGLPNNAPTSSTGTAYTIRPALSRAPPYTTPITLPAVLNTGLPLEP